MAKILPRSADAIEICNQLELPGGLLGALFDDYREKLRDAWEASTDAAGREQIHAELRALRNVRDLIHGQAKRHIRDD